VNTALQPFASRYITKMKYSEVALLTAGNIQYLFNANSVFDPNATGVGHQPYGFDQLSPIYNRYRVISCKYVVNAYSSAGGTTGAIRFGTLLANEIPPINNMSELAENPRAQTRVQIVGGSTQTIKGKISIPSLMGRTKSQYMADDRYQALVTANPQELAYLAIYAQDMADAAATVTLAVTLEYTVEFFDPHPINQS